LEKTFHDAGLTLDIVMSALDADVIKSYVELGLGVGIVASMAYNAARDNGLVLLDASHLFEQVYTRIAIRRGHLLRQYVYELIELCEPQLTSALVMEASLR